MDLLSNHFWHLFLSRIDGEINGEAWELKVTNGGERREHFCVFRRSEPLGKKQEVGEDREKYKYPSVHQRSLECGSASLWVRPCRTNQDSKMKSEE